MTTTDKQGRSLYKVIIVPSGNAGVSTVCQKLLLDYNVTYLFRFDRNIYRIL
jgi:hypothetical protein